MATLVSEAKEHDKGLKETPIHLEGSLPLVSLLDLYVVVSPAYIQLHEVLYHGVQNSDDIQEQVRSDLVSTPEPW